MPATAKTRGPGKAETLAQRWESDEKRPIRVVKKPTGKQGR